MKLLWVSNHPDAPSGYGSQTRQVGRRLLAAGIDIEFSANDGSKGGSTWEGARVRGSGGADRYSRDKVAEDFERSGATHAIVLYDPWVYTQQMADPFAGRLAIGWVPVDHFPLPPTLLPWLADHGAIAMSKFGYERLREASDNLGKSRGRPFPVFYAPHAVEPVFHPSDPIRATMDIPEDAFVVGIVAANTGTQLHDRKGFGEMAQALAPFMERHKDVWLYLHTLETGPQGMRLAHLLQAVRIDPTRVRFVDRYRYDEREIDDAEMAGIYSSLDVLLATSHGEGFGLPVLEAQACGTPVIVNNWTAQPELVGEPWAIERPNPMKYPSGWVVGAQPWYDPVHIAFYGVPMVPHIVAALEDAYENHRGDRVMRAAAVEKASAWAADKVFEEHWRPVLAELDGLSVHEARPPNRAQRRAAARAKAKVA